MREKYCVKRPQRSLLDIINFLYHIYFALLLPLHTRKILIENEAKKKWKKNRKQGDEIKAIVISSLLLRANKRSGKIGSVG